MATPNRDYRENPKRAIYITGRIDQQLVDRIAPAINEFRFESTDPITVYVDSPGGSIMLAETIQWHLKAPNPDGKKCRTITVVTSRAASAAADFVAQGDYAIGYQYADLVYHGSRVPPGEDLTTEMAALMARNLQQTNEYHAARLTRRAFPRFILRLSQFADQFKEYVNGKELSVLTKPLRGELSRDNGELVREALKRQRTIGDLSGSVSAHLRKFKNNGRNLSTAAFEAEMLRAIVKHKTRVHRHDSWLLSDTGLQEVSDDFNLLHDFHFGAQSWEIEKWYETFGELFLSEEEKDEQAKLEGTDDDKGRWLVEKSKPKLRPIWYLLISIARLLQGADYILPSKEAYWLGLIDEAPGSGLPCVRASAEATP
jgi:ATP-dependent protease ClpP protease subunit